MSRFHVVSLPHTQTTSEFISCAYTQKVVKFCRMMKARGHEIVLYSGEENEAPCDEHHVMVTDKEQRRWFGKKNLDAFYPITWNPASEHWQKTNKRVIREVKRQLRTGETSKRDLVLVIAGNCNQQIDMAIPNTCPEYGVGYTGIFGHCAFESTPHQHAVYAERGIKDGRAFDAVIPNYFDMDEFPPHKWKRGDHLLYVGRVILRKGVHIAAKVAEVTGRKLLIAGQGVVAHEPGKFVESTELRITSPNVEYIGTLDVESRAYEMSRAYAVLTPTTYLEPFGGVAVEAQLAGTPVIASNWGAFTENVNHGVSGFRAATLYDFVQAVEKAGDLERSEIRNWARSRYSLDAVAPQFEEWFARLDTLWEDGWYWLPPAYADRLAR
jgi:glycosyltransferase involved in cell wall biosynthesis